MPSLCLTKPELVDLTGYKHRPKQIEALSRMGLDFYVNPRGDVKVLRSEVESAGKPARLQPIRGLPDIEAI